MKAIDDCWLVYSVEFDCEIWRLRVVVLMHHKKNHKHISSTYQWLFLNYPINELASCASISSEAI